MSRRSPHPGVLQIVSVIGLVIAIPSAARADEKIVEFGKTWLRHTIDDSSRGADGVRLRDVNGDGLPDIATGWEEGGRIRVYRNPGPAACRKPWPAVTVGKVRSPEDAVFVDLDDDGRLDVVSSCEGGNRTMYFHLWEVVLIADKPPEL